MRKRAVSLALCLCMALLLLSPPVWATGKHPFIDVAATDWFNDSIQYVYEHGLMNGINSTTFAPDNPTSRGMIVTILHRLAGLPVVSEHSLFADVQYGSNFEDGITWGAANGIVTGYNATTFGPNDTITRQQIATFLYRYAILMAYRVDTSADLSKFVDSVLIADYAKTPMSWANAEGLINGADAFLNPTGQVNRAEAAVILTRFCKNVIAKSQSDNVSTLSMLQGTWEVDYSYTMEKNGVSMTHLFGTGIKYGSGMSLNADGTFSYSVGIGVGGEGTFSVSDNTVNYTVRTYEEGSIETSSMDIIQSDSTTYLVMDLDYDGYKLYWAKQ